MRSPRPQPATLKVLVFALGHLYLALRLDGIRKVIPMPEILKSGDKLLGIAHFETQEVMVLDLCRTIFGAPAGQPGGYLIVIQAIASLYGITVPSLPVIKTVAIADFHPVPTEYRALDTLGIAEQMAQITLDTAETVTVFLLDADQLVNLAADPQMVEEWTKETSVLP
jgi:chemotaxis signal transduction protein